MAFSQVTRAEQEAQEQQLLAPEAMLASKSAGRLRPSEPDSIRTIYQQDRDRIIHSDAFRRLSHKTQVFIAPDNDHYRTRLTHTLEVAQIARAIARGLGLNEDLAEAISLGHDLGHTPFGHKGEEALNDCLRRTHGLAADDSTELFSHNLQSLRVVDCIEGFGVGLNLSVEVRDGIGCHTGSQKAQTWEGRIVAVADRIAYVNHDIDDAVRAGLITPDMLPVQVVEVLGESRSARIDTMVTSMIEESQRVGDIRMASEVWDAMMELRSFLELQVYVPADEGMEEYVRQVVSGLFEYYSSNPARIPQGYRSINPNNDEQAVVDCIASMSDRYADGEYQTIIGTQ